jgi:predicted DNA-binding transcriptional regulator AlpA
MEELLTTAEVATLLRVKPRTVEDWRVDGTGPDYVTLSKNVVRYRPSAVDRYITEKEKAPPRRRGRRQTASAA